MTYDRKWLEARVWDMAEWYPHRRAPGNWETCILGTIVTEESGAKFSSARWSETQLKLANESGMLFSAVMNANDHGYEWGKIPVMLSLARPEPIKAAREAPQATRMDTGWIDDQLTAAASTRLETPVDNFVDNFSEPELQEV